MKYTELLEELKKGSEFKGFTLNEIRYMQACTSARIEIEREKISSAGRNFMQTGSITGRPSWIHKFMGVFSYFDYALLAFKVISGLRYFRRK